MVFSLHKIMYKYVFLLSNMALKLDSAYEICDLDQRLVSSIGNMDSILSHLLTIDCIARRIIC